MQVNSVNYSNQNNLNVANSPYSQILTLWEKMKALENEAANNPAKAHELFEEMGQIASQMQSIAKQMPVSEEPLFKKLTDAIGQSLAKFENSFSGTSGISRAYEFGSFDAEMQALFAAIAIG